MKKAKIVLLVMIMTPFFLSSVFAKNYNIPRFTDIPVVDGNISSAEQSQALQIVMSYPAIVNPPNEGVLLGDAPTDDNDLSAQWYLSWDGTSLYVACRVYDSEHNWLQPYPGRYNEQDCVQLCLNFLNRSTLNWLDGVFDLVPQTSDSHGPDFYSNPPSYLDSARLIMNGQVLSDGYIVEALIPWSSFEQDYSAHPGDVHGIGLMLVDKDDGQSTTLADFSDNGSWSLDEVSTWNTITLVTLDGCGLSQMSDADINCDCSIDLKDLSVLAEDWLLSTHPLDANNCMMSFEFINDRQFQQDLDIFAPDIPPTIPPTVVDTISWSNSDMVVWTIAQWETNFDFINRTYTKLSSGAHSYTNESKTLIVGPVNTSDAEVVMGQDSRPEYNGVHRQYEEPWPGFYLGQDFDKHPWLPGIHSLNFHTKLKLLEEGRVEGPGYNPDWHAAQFTIYFTVQNLNIASSGYGDYLWFGVQVYDDRHDVCPLYASLDPGTGKLIYNPATNVWTDELVKSGDWITLEGDMKPYILDALTYAWNNGYLPDSQNLADYSIGGMNIGWEMPGINWGVMQVDELSLDVVKDCN